MLSTTAKVTDLVPANKFGEKGRGSEIPTLSGSMCFFWLGQSPPIAEAARMLWKLISCMMWTSEKP